MEITKKTNLIIYYYTRMQFDNLKINILFDYWQQFQRIFEGTLFFQQHTAGVKNVFFSFENFSLRNRCEYSH